LERVRNLVSLGEDVDQTDGDGYTPLFIAAKKAHKDVVELLLTVGKASVDKADEDGTTPLVIAAEKGHSGVVELLLTVGKATVDRADENGTTPLLIAAEYGHKDVVELLLTAGKASVDQADVDGTTPLFIAAKKGHKDVVELLLTVGKASVDRVDAAIYWIIIEAARDGHLTAYLPSRKKTELRLTLGKADIAPRRDRYHRNALQIALDEKHLGPVILLLAHGGEVKACRYATHTIGHEAVKRGLLFREQVPLWIEQRVEQLKAGLLPVNAPDAVGDLVLEYFQPGVLEAVKALEAAAGWLGGF
jgi:ankyrin repeat protein